MTVLEMNRPMHPFGFDGGRHHSYPPDLSPYPGSATMKHGQLPPIRDLFPFIDRQQPLPLPPTSVSLASNSPNTVSAEYTLAQSAVFETRQSRPDDDSTAAAGRCSQTPRMYTDLPRLDQLRNVDSAAAAAAAAALSAPSPRRLSSGYVPTLAGDRMFARGRSFDSPTRDDMHAPALPSFRHAAGQPAMAGQQQPLPYHQSSHPAGAGQGPHMPYGSNPYQQHPSRMQSRSSDSTHSYVHAQQHQPHLMAHQHPHAMHQHPHAHAHSPYADHAPTDYYHGARYRGSHDQSAHHGSMMGMGGPRNRRGSIGKATKKRRGNLPKEFTDMFQEWLFRHVNHPYPSDEEKHDFIRRTGLDMISNWFINARRRKLPDMVRNRDGDSHASTTSHGPSEMG